MTRTWHRTSVSIMQLARNEGKFETKFSDDNLGLVLATDDEIEALYDWGTAMDEHLSCPTI